VRYSYDAHASGAPKLAGAVTVTVKVGVHQCDTAGFDRSGTVLARGSLAQLATAPAARTLARGASERFCVQQRLPADSANALQHLHVVAGLQFHYAAVTGAA
jgi:hypothetical protein